MTQRVEKILQHLKSQPTKGRIYILITGTSRGIGYELVKQYINHDPCNCVIATGRNCANVGKLKKLKELYGDQVILEDMDVSDERSIIRAKERIRNITDNIDILINNAGISNDTHPWEGILTADTDEMMRILKTNTVGTHLVTKHFFSLMNNKDVQNVVLNVSSGLGSIYGIKDRLIKRRFGEKGMPYSYCVSKAGVNMVTRCYGFELGRKYNIIFCTLSPGWVNTDMGSSYGKRKSNKMQSMISVEYCAASIIKFIKNMDMDTHNGMFYDYKNNSVPF